MKEFSTYFLDENNYEKFLLEAHIIENNKDIKEYDDFLSQLPDNPFLKKELLSKDSDQDLGYFTLHNSSNILLVVLPFIRRKIFINEKDTGYYDVISPYGFVGPLFNRGIDEGTMKQFWEQVDQWYLKNNVVSEFIRFNFNHNYLGFTGSMVPTLKMVCGKIIEDDEQWMNFKPKVRNNVRKAVRNGLKGVVYHENIKEDTIQEFYNIYSKTMDRHDAESRYRYSFEFFRDFMMNNPKKCAVAVVYKKEKAISVELMLLSDNIVYSFLGGTDEAYFHARPNDLLKLVVINWSRENGYKYYFLGGGKTEKDSLYLYKKRFFPKDEDHTFYTGRKILNKKVYDILVKMKHNSSKSLSNQFFPLYRYNGN